MKTAKISFLAVFSVVFAKLLFNAETTVAQAIYDTPGGTLPDASLNLSRNPDTDTGYDGYSDDPFNNHPYPHVHRAYPFLFRLLIPGPCIPDDGYRFESEDRSPWPHNFPSDPNVVCVPYGTPSTRHWHMIWNGQGQLLPEPGWQWAPNGKFKVVRIPPPRWETDPGYPRDAQIKNFEGDRSAYKYSAVIEQFDVKHDKRYQKRPLKDKNGNLVKDGKGHQVYTTYCNIFAWDVTRAMGAELPQGLLANQTYDWLNNQNGHGLSQAWFPVDPETAQQMANEGKPTIAIWKNPNPDDHGHEAVVRPGSSPLASNSPKFNSPALAQAGSNNEEAIHLEEVFKDPERRSEVQFWYHN